LGFRLKAFENLSSDFLSPSSTCLRSVMSTALPNMRSGLATIRVVETITVAVTSGPLNLANNTEFRLVRLWLIRASVTACEMCWRCRDCYIVKELVKSGPDHLSLGFYEHGLQVRNTRSRTNSEITIPNQPIFRTPSTNCKTRSQHWRRQQPAWW